MKQGRFLTEESIGVDYDLKELLRVVEKYIGHECDLTDSGSTVSLPMYGDPSDLRPLPMSHLGVAVKCYTDSTKMNLVKVNEEISKFNRTLEACLASKPRVRGVLLICSTSKFEGAHFDQFNHPSKKNMVFKTSNSSLEVIILNLSTKDLRESFFGLAVNCKETRLRNAEVIETIIPS